MFFFGRNYVQIFIQFHHMNFLVAIFIFYFFSRNLLFFRRDFNIFLSVSTLEIRRRSPLLEKMAVEQNDFIIFNLICLW